MGIFNPIIKKYKTILFVILLSVNFSVEGQETIWADDFETDKGWAFTGEFERGTPNGGNGDHGEPNPTSAYNGSNAIGTDLDGAYPDNLNNREYSATSPTIDCSGYGNITLNFQRWLNLEQNQYDQAYIDFYDGSDWINIWENPNTTYEETAWTLQSISLPTQANNNANLKIRFALGATDGGWYYSGWNIDDIEITGTAMDFPAYFGQNPGLVFWLKGDIGVSGINPITNWTDQSGNGNNANPDPDGPELITSTNMNNKQALLFNGANELNIADNARINTGTGYNGNEKSMALAFTTQADITSTQYLFEEGGGTNGLGVFIKNSIVYVTVYNDGNTNNRVTVFSDVNANTSYVLSFVWDNGILAAKLNNIAFSGQSSNGTITTLKGHGGDVSVGFTDGTTRDETGAQQAAGANFSGEIAEILYYDKALLEEEELDINNDLAEKYGVLIDPITNYYTYRSGDWDEIGTWTHDPGGTTQTATELPDDNDKITLLSGRTITLLNNINANSLDVTIREGAFLNLGSYEFTNGLRELHGKGTIKIGSSYFPSVSSNNTFIEENGGTVEFTANITLPSQITYNHLAINTSGTVLQLNNLILNGDLTIEQGKLQMNDATDQRLQTLVKGNIQIQSGAEWTVGTGNTTVGGNVSGGTAPFTNYYDTYTHRIVAQGNFTNHGTVKFTNQGYPEYQNFTTTGAATVFFTGATNNTLTCNGTTDFYNLVLDKGIDQSFKLTVYSTAYNNFRLFGRNSYGGENGGANPNLRKALWIRTGTLELTGLTTIPSLTEGGDGGNPNSDFYIPANGALLLNGPDVVVLSTADDYTEINAAYELTGGSNNEYDITRGTGAQSFSIYGKFQINDGYFSTRESGGFITWSTSSGTFVVNGGTVDAKQFRAAGGSDGKAAYYQNGGSVEFRGRYSRDISSISSVADLRNAPLSNNPEGSGNGIDGGYGTLNINYPANVFNMTGGVINIYDVCGNNNYAVDVFAEKKNINVTGGTIAINAQNNTTNNFIIRSAAPFYNFTINNGASNTSQIELSNATGVDGNLEVINNLNVTSGTLATNNYNVSIGKNMTVSSDGIYTPGSNHTIFNGDNNQSLTLNSTTSFNKLSINKPSGTVLSLEGTENTVQVADSLTILKGTLNDNGKTLQLAGHIYNSGVHTGAGKLVLNGTTAQNIDGNGLGIFNNVDLNNANQTITTKANATVNGNLTFLQDQLFDIGENNLSLTETGSIVGVNSNRYIKTAGNAGDGGLSLAYNSIAEKLFPLGVNNYTPANIGFTDALDSYGSITIIPVNYEHTTTTSNGEALNYFWRVKSVGFTNFTGKVTHTFTYNQAMVSGNESMYMPAVYSLTNYSWFYGTTAEVDAATNQISDWLMPSQSSGFIDGDYTAGEASAFGTPEKYYSRQSGNWSNANTWSNTGHTGAAAADSPDASDIVIIGNNHTVSLTRNENSASLQIEDGATLDIYTYTGSDFGMVMSHTNGNGLFRLTTPVAPDNDIPQFFTFPAGDFSDFNTNQGTTEYYDIDGTVGALYILPESVDSYGNLILSAKGGDNIVLPNNSYTTIHGDLTCSSVDNDTRAWIVMAWNTNVWPYNSNDYNPVLEKTVHIKGNLDIDAGTFMFLNNESPQHLIVDGDITVDSDALMEVYPDYPLSTPQPNTVAIGGSLINNNVAEFKDGNYYCDVTFFGDTPSMLTNTSGTPTTTFNTLTVNKGNSASTSLTINIAGALNTPDDDWLTLQNGELIYQHQSDRNITTTSEFHIPQTAALTLNANGYDITLANANSNNNDVFLNGKLTVINGNVVIGNGNNYNNDIEYSGNGYSEIDMQGGSLFVNGQIRRNPSTTAGVLKYSQSGASQVTINGRNALQTNAKLEVLNTGSAFNMSGTSTLTIVRGGGNGTYGDLYLRPDNSSVTGGSIIFSNDAANSEQNYLLDATVPLNNLSILAPDGNNALVKLLISPLQLKGDLLIADGSSIFDANANFDINVSIKGNFDNSGTYNHYKNTTTFNGGVQEITGTTPGSFYNLVVEPITRLTLSGTIDIDNNLTLSDGTLECGNHQVTVIGDFTNNANYSESGTGIVLQGGDIQYISGTGTFGRLELDNASGARLNNAITLNKNLALTRGIFDINKYLLTLGENSAIEGTNFNESKMITSDGVFSNVGINKVFSSTGTFTYPLGTSGKYTPAVLTINNITGTGAVRLNNINDKHPATLSPRNVLKYFWEVSSTAISGFEGNLEFNYKEDDVDGTETDYLAARLITSNNVWSKTDNVDENNNTISFSFNAGTTDLSGEYTAGEDPSIPSQVPEFSTTGAGTDWSDQNSWTNTGGDAYACPPGGPNGFVVIINHEINADIDKCYAYKTYINNKLHIDGSTYGHNLGTIYGSGTLSMEDGTLPAGRYNQFFDCSNNSTLEYTGSGDYAIIADLFDQLANVQFTGTGTRIVPNKTLTICNQLVIDGPTLDNSINNQHLIIQGTMERYNTGAFISGSGANAKVTFNGTSEQTVGGTLGDFSGTNAFNHLEINNAQGMSINTNGEIEVKGNLLLTNGNIKTSSTNTLTITNTSPNCVVPFGGSATSYVNGPLKKKINQGDSFKFPVGNDDGVGNKIELTSTRSGTITWTVQHFSPNDTYTSYDAPLSYVNSNEFWQVNAAVGSQAKINIDWDSDSDLTPTNTQNGLSDMRVAYYRTATTTWNELDSEASGNDNNGTVGTTNRVTIPAADGYYRFTTACINTVKPRAKLTPSGPICGNAGIPITFSSNPGLNYLLSYTVDGVPQPDVSVTATPYVLPTIPTGGVYQLTAFTYDSGNKTGAVNKQTVTVYENPTTALAGNDQSHCGMSSTTLDANDPSVGIGLWTIDSGNGGSFVDATEYNTTFNGTNGSAYTLTWTISNGGCESSDEVDVVFPLLAAKPDNFIASDNSVCREEQDVVYTVPNDATVTYDWTYTGGTGATIFGSGNSITINFANDATDGYLNVTASNACGASDPRTLAITVNPLPVVTLSNDDSDNLICTGTEVVFTANSSTGPAISNYDFTIDGNTEQNTASNTFARTTLANYDTVAVIASTAAGCTSSSNEIAMSVADNIWTGNNNSDWFNNSNWACGDVPDNLDDLIVPTGALNMPEIDAAGAEFRNIIIENAASLSTMGTNSIDIYGDWTNDGYFMPNSGTIHVRGNTEISGSTETQFNHLNIHPASNMISRNGNINISGNFTNSGSFTHNSGTITVNGSSAQEIAGTFLAANVLNNVVIDNPAGVTLASGDKTIEGNLTLASGLLHSAGLLTLGQNAITNVSAASGKVSSYIEGALSKVVLGDNNGQFFFPIGTATLYKPVGISNVSGGVHTWTASYNETPEINPIAMGEPIIKITEKESWTINCAAGTANITLSWHEYMDSKIYVDNQNLSSLRVAHLNNSSEWVSTGVLSSTTGEMTDFGTITSSTPVVFDGSKKSTSGPEEFTLASTTSDHALPVVWHNVYCIPNLTNVEVFWSTLSETNNEFFEVQRAGNDGTFKTIAKISGAGNSSSQNTYSYVDENPIIGISYYRIKQVDFDGQSDYSKTTVVEYKGFNDGAGKLLTLCPNPYNGDELALLLTGFDSKNSLTITVTNITGKVIKEFSIDNIPQRLNLIPNKIERLPKGVYLINIVNDGSRFNKRLVVN